MVAGSVYGAKEPQPLIYDTGKFFFCLSVIVMVMLATLHGFWYGWADYTQIPVVVWVIDRSNNADPML